MNTLNTLAWSHPYLLVLTCVLMYVLCWVPLLMQRRAQNTPTQAFLATFATPPTHGNVRILRTEPAYHTPQALIDACNEAVAWANTPVEAVLNECDAELARLSAKIEYFAHTVEQIANGTAHTAHTPEVETDEVENALARLVAEIEQDEIERANAQAVAHAVEATKIQHFASSTERMRAQRAAYAAQGLTARGTQPMPTCTGVTKAGKPCKRKATALPHGAGEVTCLAHA